MKNLILATIFLNAFFNLASRACTVFCLRPVDGLMVARNFDFPVGQGLIVLNPAQKAKKSFAVDAKAPLLEWRSRYGSLTFNQAGIDFPNGGMNEAGLVIEALWLDETAYPATDSRRTLTELQWVQFQLDNYASVAEIATHLEDIRIAELLAPLHYFLADRSGATAVLEWIDGRAVLHVDHVQALANDSYADSLRALNGEMPKVTGSQMDVSLSSAQRFLLAQTESAASTTDRDSSESLRHAFASLNRVAQGTFTKWNIVYDLAKGLIYFRYANGGGTQRFALSDFDFKKLNRQARPILDTQGKVRSESFRDTGVNRLACELLLQNQAQLGPMMQVPAALIKFLSRQQ